MQTWKGPGQKEPDKEYKRVIVRAARPVITATITTAIGATMAHPPRRGNAQLGRSYNGLFLQAIPTVLGMMPLMMVQGYRTKRAEFGPMGACHLEPTCSTYAEQVLQEHGSLKGGILIAKRIYRCRRIHG